MMTGLRLKNGEIPTVAMSHADVRSILDNVTFAPSCVDMGWGWEIEGVYCDLSEAAGQHPIKGWNVRTSFKRPDTDTGEIGTGYGRWWFVERKTSRSGVVKTAWLACKQIVEHELMEAFLFDGSRVFNPHASIESLVDLNRRD